MRIVLDLAGFASKNDAAAAGYIRPLLLAMIGVNLSYLDRFPRTPLLYEAGVVYMKDPKDSLGRPVELWQDIPSVIASGGADCEDLSTWRCAELLYRGFPARPIVTVRRFARLTLYHVKIAVGSRREDPSRRLGMTSRHG